MAAAMRYLISIISDCM